MSSAHRLHAILLVLPVLGLSLGLAPAFAAAPSVVQVELNNTGKMETMKLDRATVPAGMVRFEVTNASFDDAHEMIVVKTEAGTRQVSNQQGRQQGQRGQVHGRRRGRGHQIGWQGHPRHEF